MLPKIREAALREAKLIVGIVLALLFTPAALNAQSIPGALPESTAALSRGEWPAYAGTYAAARYSPLTQIDRGNAKDLHIAWRWKSPDHAIKDGNPKVAPSRANESTPLMVGGVLYTSTSLSQVAAIDAVSGETKWVFDPKVYDNGSRHSRQQRLAASRRRLLAQRRRRAHCDPHRVRADDRAGCEDRQAGAGVRHRRQGRSRRRPAAAGGPRLLHHDVAAGDRARRDRGRLVGDGLVGPPAVAAWATYAASMS